MRVFSAEDIDAALDFPSLIDALDEAMRGGFVAPGRHHHEIERAGEAAATQLLMPVWTQSGADSGAYLGAKIVNVFPGNSARGLPAVLGPLCAAIRPNRRDARRARRHAADPLAHRGRFRARGATSGARGRQTSADCRRRRAGAVPRAGACEPAPLRGDRGLEPPPGGCSPRRRRAGRPRIARPRAGGPAGGGR